MALRLSFVAIGFMYAVAAEEEPCREDAADIGSSCSSSLGRSASLLQKTFQREATKQTMGLLSEAEVHVGSNESGPICPGVKKQGKCWLLSELGESCSATCAKNSQVFSYAVADNDKPLIPQLVGRELAKRLTKQEPWAALECFEPGSDSFHMARANAAAGDLRAWTHPRCKLACPCGHGKAKETCTWKQAPACAEYYATPEEYGGSTPGVVDWMGIKMVGGCLRTPTPYGEDKPWCVHEPCKTTSTTTTTTITTFTTIAGCSPICHCSGCWTPQEMCLDVGCKNCPECYTTTTTTRVKSRCEVCECASDPFGGNLPKGEICSDPHCSDCGFCETTTPKMTTITTATTTTFTKLTGCSAVCHCNECWDVVDICMDNDCRNCPECQAPTTTTTTATTHSPCQVCECAVDKGLLSRGEACLDSHCENCPFCFTTTTTTVTTKILVKTCGVWSDWSECVYTCEAPCETNNAAPAVYAAPGAPAAAPAAPASGDGCKWIPPPSCVAEFNFSGGHYVGCTAANHDTPWCSNSDPFTGSWSHCQDTCAKKPPTNDQLCSWQKPKECAKTFVHKGVEYFGCTETDDASPWCYDVNENKKRCKEVCYDVASDEESLSRRKTSGLAVTGAWLLLSLVLQP